MCPHSRGVRGTAIEDSKNVYIYYEKSGKDFHLWEARTEASLEAKEVKYVIQSDVFVTGEQLTKEQKKNAATARAILIQGLGD